MAFAETYERQVTLLIRVMPMVMAEPCFALKGGTAINLLIRNLPRLSVDIDLTYLPVQDRATSLAEIEAALLRIAARIEAGIARVRVQPSRSQTDNAVTKLVIRVDNVQIKIEVTPVLRGCVFDPEPRDVSAAVEDRFGFATARLSPSPISMPVRLLRPWIASTRATSLLRSHRTPCPIGKRGIRPSLLLNHNVRGGWPPQARRLAVLFSAPYAEI